MLKRYLSIFFTVFFMAIIVAPSVLLLTDDTIDVSFLMDASEEEEEKGKDKNKIEVVVIESDSDNDNVLNPDIEDNLGYTFKTYPKPHLNLISPPPEFIS